MWPNADLILFSLPFKDIFHFLKNSVLPHHITTNFTRNTKVSRIPRIQDYRDQFLCSRRVTFTEKLTPQVALAIQVLWVDWIHQCLILSPFTNINFNDKTICIVNKEWLKTLYTCWQDLRKQGSKYIDWGREQRIHCLFCSNQNT